jgi:NitT/TauT family transport system ATP-binding protein
MLGLDNAALEFRQIAQRFPSPAGPYSALDGVDLTVASGRFVSVVGPSGCGKSTLLNIAAGLMQPSAGHVAVFGGNLDGINRRAAYMFQQDALLPWKSVLDNVALGLEFQGLARAAARDRASIWLHRVGLDGFGHSFPYQLSAGMRKRAAMAQCWITGPDIVLMDEPFSALDVHTRLRMQQEILTLWAETQKTVLFVTHDLEEAIALSDEVAVLSAGPASRIVALHPVDIPRPRDLLDIRTHPRFLDLYKSIWADLRTQVLKSYERA